MKIKICGLFRPCDIEYVNLYKPDYIGFVFAKSKRQISKEQAFSYKSNLDKAIKAVGVFVDEEISVIQDIVAKGIIDSVQLHGKEDADYLLALRASLPKIEIIKAIAVGGERPDISPYTQANALLFDSSKAGSGTAFDWKNLPKTGQKFFLAGGITLQNIDKAMKENPYALDISSGAEINGFKDKETIKELVQKVRYGK